MNIDVNPLYVPVFTAKCRYFHLWGGRGRGASHFATDYFLFRLTEPKYFKGVMLRATMAQIKKSLWVALNNRIKTAIQAGHIAEEDLRINLSEHTVTYIPTGNVIICHGFRKTTTAAAADLKGLEGVTHAIVEEAEDVQEQDFRELSSSLRTVEVENIQILVLFNPPGKNHWLIKRNYNLIPVQQYPGWYKARQKEDTPELLSIHSTYMDNTRNLNESNIREYLSYGDSNSHGYDLDYYCRSVLGLISEGKKGRIFLNVKHIPRKLYDELPYPEFCGLDFGFNAPTAVAKNKYHAGRLYSCQAVYTEGLTNRELTQAMKKAGVSLEMKLYADPADPQSIKTIRRYGFNIHASIKGADSIEYGYREMLNIDWYVTDDSADLWEEIEEHTWESDADGNPTDMPEDNNNHLIDAVRYAFTMHVARTAGGRGVTSVRDDGDDSSGPRSRLLNMLDAIGDEVRADQALTRQDIADSYYHNMYE